MFKSLVFLGTIFAASSTFANTEEQQPEQILEGNSKKEAYIQPSLVTPAVAPLAPIPTLLGPTATVATPTKATAAAYVAPAKSAATFVAPSRLTGPTFVAPAVDVTRRVPAYSAPFVLDQREVIAPARVHRPYSKYTRDSIVAKALNISEPVYICPKPGYVLYGEDCVYTDAIPTRLECPIGYAPMGGISGRPDLCHRRISPSLSCSHGHLVNGICRISEFSEPIFSCPHGSELAADGMCTQLELVEPLARCPDGSTRINHNCVVIDYLAPSYVCPPNSIQDGKRCRVETLVVSKKKGRKLEGEATEDKDSTMSGESYVAEGDYLDDGLVDDIDLLSELPSHVYEVDDYEGETTWLPATNGLQIQDTTQFLSSGKKYHSNYKKGHYGWNNGGWASGLTPVGGWNNGLGTAGSLGTTIGVAPINNNVLLPVQPQPVAVEVPLVAKAKKRTKEIKVKIPKTPDQFVRIDAIPAQKVCEIGERVGATCAVQTIVESILECPVPLINGQCARLVHVPGITRCPVGNLVCPPNLPGRACQCETILETTPAPICNSGIFDLGECVATAHPKEYCPIGSFLDADGDMCIRRDVEPALCLFSVTYSCPECHGETPFETRPYAIPGPLARPLAPVLAPAASFPLAPASFPVDTIVTGRSYELPTTISNSFPVASQTVIVDQPELITTREVITKGRRGDIRWGK